ncbi:hypothetical protein A2U01_0016037, partial [Trifolium medium]|nr:hypothetical protein [Trifolium medium]
MPTAIGVHTIVEDREEGQEKNWDVYCPTEGRRICSKFSEDGFAMYEFVFKDLRFRSPFSHLAVGVFGWLNLAPSQLHPNSLPFIRAFEMLCEYHEVEPTLSLFFHFFKLQRQSTKDGRHSWLAVDSLFETELDAEEDGAVRRDEEGNEMTR